MIEATMVSGAKVFIDIKTKYFLNSQENDAWLDATNMENQEIMIDSSLVESIREID